jgi:hypothetical protein
MFVHGIDWRIVVPLILKLLKAFGLIPGFMAAYGIRKLFQKWRQKHAMDGWPSTEARILWGMVHSEGPRRIWAEITYSYYVGEYRSGTYLRVFRREEDADEFVRQIKDRKLQIRYKESNPEASTILECDLQMIAPISLQSHSGIW